jgi:four helix bundle protein
MSNIAEGFERDGNREFRQFLFIAKGSAGESLSQLYAARDQGLVSEDEFATLTDLVQRTSRAIGGLIRYLGSSSMPGRKFRRLNPKPET